MTNQNGVLMKKMMLSKYNLSKIFEFIIVICLKNMGMGFCLFSKELVIKLVMEIYKTLFYYIFVCFV